MATMQKTILVIQQIGLSLKFYWDSPFERGNMKQIYF